MLLMSTLGRVATKARRAISARQREQPQSEKPAGKRQNSEAVSVLVAVVFIPRT